MTTSVAHCGEVEISYQDFGECCRPAVVLVMGLGMQMIAWETEFCALLAAEGFRVVRFDNRDVGLSTHLTSAGVPDLSPLMSGRPLSDAPYLLADMADDTARLMDALGLADAHLVGASMGGMIAQELAIRHPSRVRTLISLMSTPAPTVGAATSAAAAVLFTPPATTEEGAGERALEIARVIGSPGYPLDEEGVVVRAREAFRRANDPAGIARQLAAIHVSGDRREALGGLATPTLVMHGEADPLVGVDGGRETARAVPGARLVTFPGMGHDLPRALWPRLIEEIAGHARRADEATA